MHKKQLIGIAGSILLFIGVFSPIISIPLFGNVNFFRNGKGDGTIIIILAIISLFLCITKRYKGLWYTGFASIGITAFTFIQFQMRMSEVKVNMQKELAGNPFKNIAYMAMDSVQLQWGWALLIIGSALVIAAAAIKDETMDTMIIGEKG